MQEKLKKAEEQMYHNAEKVEDDVRQRVQDCKDEIWEEFAS